MRYFAEGFNSINNKSKRKTILLANADLTEIRDLEEELKKRGFRVFAVRSGRELIDHLRSWKVEVVIIDTQLSDLYGYKLIPLIKEISGGTKVIVTTNDDNPAIEPLIRQEGIVYLGYKPVEIEQMIGIVTTAVNN